MRVLQVGYGVIGREVFIDYSPALAAAGHEYMLVDRAAEVPLGYEWDGGTVDIAVILVNTPASGICEGFDYTDLLAAIDEYAAFAEFILIRSTVSLDFLNTSRYRSSHSRIGFSPEFYGATQWSSRGVLDLGFSIYTENVPEWFVWAASSRRAILATPEEVIVAKLAENAYLATKVTFFHELALACDRLGIDPAPVRHMVTSDPRIGTAHSYMEEPGWQSHCFDKDVPEYARVTGSHLVSAAILTNRGHLLPARKPPVEPQN